MELASAHTIVSSAVELDGSAVEVGSVGVPDMGEGEVESVEVPTPEMGVGEKLGSAEPPRETEEDEFKSMDALKDDVAKLASV